MITITRKLELESVSIIVLAAMAGTFFAIYNNNHPPKMRVAFNTPIVQESRMSTSVSAVSPLSKPAPMPKTETVLQLSPDGTKAVVMKTVYNTDNTRSYTFYTADNSGDENGIISNQQTIYTKTLDDTKIMSIPFNTWSPDNKYFFIQEQTKDGITTGVYAFKALGEVFADAEKYLDVTELFKQRNTLYNLTEATGWASETLIIVNTITQDGTKGPSFWFEVPSKAILQLSMEF